MLNYSFIARFEFVLISFCEFFLFFLKAFKSIFSALNHFTFKEMHSIMFKIMYIHIKCGMASYW